MNPTPAPMPESEMQARLLLEPLNITELREVARRLNQSGWYSLRRYDLTDRLATVPFDELREAIAMIRRVPRRG
jgi:hypothetical protein